jgi:nitrite reductase/ring-hydroxylating ferredoxin subunit
MTRWVDAGPLAGLKFDPGASVQIGGHWLAVFPLEGDYHVIDNACPHASAPLCDGTVMDGKIVCPLHLWEFDIKSGVCDVGGEWNVQSYASRVVGDRLEIDLPE